MRSIDVYRIFDLSKISMPVVVISMMVRVLALLVNTLPAEARDATGLEDHRFSCNSKLDSVTFFLTPR
jgi:hypothetical protein